MLSTDGYIIVIMLTAVAVTLLAALGILMRVFGTSRRAAIAVNITGASLVALTVALTSWALGSDLYARIVFASCMLAGGIIAVNFLALYQENRVARNGKSTLDKLRVNKARP